MDVNRTNRSWSHGVIGFRLFVEQMRVYLDFIVSQLEVYDWFQTIEVAYRRARAFVVSE